MSTSDVRSRGRLTPRVVRVRNRCLALLAARRGLPAPNDSDLGAVGDDVGLGDAWRQFEKIHTPAGAVPPVPRGEGRRRRWRSRSLMTAGFVSTVAIVGFMFRDQLVRLAGAQADAGTLALEWAPITDSAAATLSGKLFTLASSQVRIPLVLSAPEAASLIVRSTRRNRAAPMDSLEARSDSLLWIRGRLRNGTRLELAGRLALRRRGLAEFRVERAMASNGADVPLAAAARLMSGGRAASVDAATVYFIVPAFVADLRVESGVSRPTR